MKLAIMTVAIDLDLKINKFGADLILKLKWHISNVYIDLKCIYSLTMGSTAF